MQNISPAEWRIMELLWEEEPRSAADLAGRLGESPGWARTTVKTLVARLVKKGVVVAEAEPGSNRFLYRPAADRAGCQREESRSFVDRIFGGDAGVTAAHLIRNATLTVGQIEELRSLLDGQEERQRERPGHGNSRTGRRVR